MPTIASTLRLGARRVPNREALVSDGRRLTYAELDAEVDRVALVLARLGLGKGERFALIAGNSDRFVITFYAAARLGAIIVPINPASAPPEIEYVLRDSGAAVLAFDPALTEKISQTEALGLPPTVRCVVGLGQNPRHDDLIASAASEDVAEIEDVVREPDDSLILYTSGTTGHPKGALFDHRRTLLTAMTMIATCGMRDGDRLLHVAPLYHAAELCIMLIPGTWLGATHVVHTGFDPTAVLDALERERITMFFGVPTMYQFLLRESSFASRDLSSWRTGMFGAAPMPASAVEKLIAAVPHVEIMQLCGQTEAGPSGIYLTAEQVRERPDASGRQPLLNTEARIVDANGRETAPGDVGELLLRGELTMKGYWGKPAETAEAIHDGWLHTGDLARVDASGYITLVDRLKDMIITGGRNVYSVEVEDAIAAHPGVVDCAVVGRPHSDYGESIVAVVTATPGTTLTLDDIRAFCRNRIAAYKLPHDLVLGEIPRNPAGKIKKYQLRSVVAGKGA